MLHIEICRKTQINKKLKERKKVLFIYFCYSYNKTRTENAQRVTNFIATHSFCGTYTNIRTHTQTQNYESNCVCKFMYEKMFICLFVCHQQLLQQQQYQK